MKIKTLAPNASGDTNAWSGTYADIGEVTLNTSTMIYTDTADTEFQCNVTGMPSGVFSVRAVGLSFQACQGTAGLLLQPGLRSNGTTALLSAQALDTYWAPDCKIYEVNPVTSNPFTTNEIESLQMAFKAVAA